jgi:CRP/FNR family transcriptional regulator, cyclic AMP receptor protein
MDQQTLLKVLTKLHFTASLPEPVIAKLAAAASGHRFHAGTVLFREKSQNDRLMLIFTGKVALDIQVPGRGNLRILELEPGDVVGWSALLGGGKMTTTATALEDTQVVSFSAEELLAACEANHSFGYFLMSKVANSLAERLLDTRMQLIDLLTFEQAIQINPQKPRRG